MAQAPSSAELTRDVTRGITRLLLQLGYMPLTEFTLPSGRRADVAGLSDSGEFIFVEVKVSLADFVGDEKWGEYLDYCDRFYFAVPQDFPLDRLPSEQGLMIADRFGGDVVREAALRPMAPARRRSLLIRFARAAIDKSIRLTDPDLL